MLWESFYELHRNGYNFAHLLTQLLASRIVEAVVHVSCTCKQIIALKFSVDFPRQLDYHHV